MKKIICLILMCLLIVGCNSTKEPEEINVKVEEKYSLVSTDDRLVFNYEDNYEIVYYEDGNIVKVETAIKFLTEEEAKQYFKEEQYGSSETIRRSYDVVIIEETDDYWEDYKNLSPEDLKTYMANAEYTFVN